jgi:uncharacterized heparinase superfamily protein
MKSCTVDTVVGPHHGVPLGHGRLESPEIHGWNGKAARLWCLLRYYKTQQLAMRAVRLTQRRAMRITGGRSYSRLAEAAPRIRSDAALERLAHNKLAERPSTISAANSQRVRDGRFRFLNVERSLPDPIDWRLEGSPEVNHLWRFHLHYHEFLLDLAAEGLRTGERQWPDRAWDIVDQWVNSNPLSDPRVQLDAWHPYCISRRLTAWIYLWLVSAPTAKLRTRVLGSMLSQARLLEDQLEWDLGGNHLLENVRALILTGCFLDGPHADRWCRKGARILRKELPQQILAHGEHFERSPMYHAEMLEAVLDVRDAVAWIMPNLARLCDQVGTEMAGFLHNILHPDGEIPLLGDSCFGQTAPAGQLMTRARADGVSPCVLGKLDTPDPSTAPSSRAVGDYWAYRSGQDFLLLDAGRVGPDHLPAHAHADLLTFEGSIAGNRLFVDSGVFNYEDDAMRRYCRSSAAHNVLQIDGQDQCDMWSRFRMGYRGWPADFAQGESQGFHWARAEHNAYRRIGVPGVGRWMACRPGGPWLCVDWTHGVGQHELTAWLHLHPDAAAEKIADHQVLIELHGLVLTLRYLVPGRVAIDRGWYCPEFGKRVSAPVVRWSVRRALPAYCGWSLSWGGCRGTASLDTRRAHKPAIRWQESDRTMQVQVTGS